MDLTEWDQKFLRALLAIALAFLLGGRERFLKFVAFKTEFLTRKKGAVYLIFSCKGKEGARLLLTRINYLKLLIRTTSLFITPREKAICLPSRDQAKSKLI